MNHEAELPDGIGLADFLDRWIRDRSLEKAADNIEARFQSYLRDLRLIGIVSGVLIGSRADERRGYAWNILAQDFSPNQPADLRFRELNLLTYELERDFADVLPLRVSHLNSSQLEEHERRCQKQGLELNLIPL